MMHKAGTNGRRESVFEATGLADPVTTEIIRYSLLSITDQIEAK